MHFHIISIFPEALEPYLNSSMLFNAQKNKKIKISLYNPRTFSKKKYKKASPNDRSVGRVDDRPYGGGPGMVMTAQPILDAVKKAKAKVKGQKSKIIILSPRGEQFTNVIAATYAKKYKHLILICGHYEGIDARVKKILKAEELSVGPYVLTGGELPAMVVVDAVARQIDGVLGHPQSREESRTTSGEVYTRPEVLEHQGKKYKVPKVLKSGNHADIENWKKGKV